MKPIDVSLNRLAARQYSLAHRRQLLDHGMTARQIHARLEAGLLVPVHRGVYRLPGASPRKQSLRRLAGCGRNGAGVLRALVEERDPLTAPTQSQLEDELFRTLRRSGLPAPVRQYEVGGVFLDGAYPDVKLGIEADSRIWHGGRLDVQRNSDKANLLVAHGWRVLRFTWRHVRRQPAYVVAQVGRELALACPA